MASLKPFRAWRPKPEYITEITCLPYDVVDTKKAREILSNQAYSYMKVIRPEADFKESIPIYSKEVYVKGRDNLHTLLSSEKFLHEKNDALYVYQLKWDKGIKTGIFGCVSVDDYDNGVILKHELTQPDKEDDRTKHILTQKAHAEPVMLTFESSDAIQSLINEAIVSSPLYTFTTEDEVEHIIWRLDHTDSMVEAFKTVDHIYIADGHHRCASASRASKKMPHHDHPDIQHFPAVLFPMDEVQILSYNRIVYNVNDNFIDHLKTKYPVITDASPIPDKSGYICLYFKSKWYGFSLPQSKHEDLASQLDVARLQEFILEPYFGITNQRLDNNISFVGGIHGSRKLESIVDSGTADVAISMFPTSIDELIAVSDAGLLMPPKSTWFEPKLRSGLLIHTF